jgi:tripartite-type tricarboxylate transporter receptor subunit TctC
MLAVTSAKRTATFPNVPTVSEIVPGVQASVSFWGISAPARTPTVIVKRLEAALMPIITAPDVQARLIEPAVGMVPMPLNSEQFVEFIKHQNSAWMPLIKSNHITID